MEDPSCFEAYIERCSARLGIPVPEHPAIDWIYVLLKLKPRNCSLEVFWRYMVCVSRCCESDFFDFHEFDSINLLLMHENEIYFHLSELDSSDLRFLFTEIIGVVPIKDISDNKTGDSLCYGGLATYFKLDDYKRIMSFMYSAKTSFSDHLRTIAPHTRFPFIETRLDSLFHMSGKFLIKSLPGTAYPPIVWRLNACATR
jgi:hypothetical protein